MPIVKVGVAIASGVDLTALHYTRLHRILRAMGRICRLANLKNLSPRCSLPALAIIGILLFVSETSPQQNQLQDWLSYYPAVSRLEGKLVKITKYGKPTYGENPETDEKVEVCFLILPVPARVKARSSSSVNNESITNLSFVQLIFPPEISDYAKYLEKQIVVAGTLVRGYKGEHFAEAVMTVKAINPTGKPM